MSVFTNPASGAPGQADEYVRAVLNLLGSRDPYSVLESTPAALNGLVRGMPAERMATPEAEGKWSVRHVLRHLADSEIVWAFRIRLVWAQHRPQLTGYDQDLWSERLAYADSDPATSLAEFGVLRRSNLNLLAGASETDLLRVGVHVERGEESLEHMTRLYAGHDLLHLRQLERIRAKVSE